MSTRVEDYLYDLPEELIASRPLPRRDDSRMMVLSRSARTWEHRTFRELPDFLQPGDLAVLNNSRVLRARLPGPEGKGEVLLAEPLGDHRWLCLVKPGRKWPIGAEHPVAGTTARVLEVLPGGERILQFGETPDLEKYGQVPLPPYLRREADEQDAERYQTVYADPGGSVAAPTAGLHFTPEILARLPHAFLTLHVGLGTFQPVKCEDVADHTMHEENYVLPPETCGAINQADRVLAVGTTVTRVLESQPDGPLRPVAGRTGIFLHPPYRFRHVDLLLTNFHLPGSTLIMLVSALAGREFTLAAYAEAVRQRYRFFSYGDCMLILP
jgi:S-adenosylmethionine:tRNA ribosyltransferase-isomerase